MRITTCCVANIVTKMSWWTSFSCPKFRRVSCWHKISHNLIISIGFKNIRFWHTLIFNVSRSLLFLSSSLSYPTSCTSVAPLCTSLCELECSKQAGREKGKTFSQNTTSLNTKNVLVSKSYTPQPLLPNGYPTNTHVLLLVSNLSEVVDLFET
jgi:hypothetical protein